MYIVMDNSDYIVSFDEHINYVKTQVNGTTIITEPHDATAVYTPQNDTFYRLRDSAPGDEKYRVVVVDKMPEDIDTTSYKYVDGGFVPTTAPTDRITDIEDALVELAGLVGGGYFG